MSPPQEREGRPSDRAAIPTASSPHQANHHGTVNGRQGVSIALVPADTDPDELEVLAGVAAWARPFLRGDAPVFGSPEWLVLPVEDHRRDAAVVRAALAWWRVGEPLEDVEARAAAALDVASSHDIAGAVRWGDLAYRPTHAELARRRDWSARRDRPDYPGGAVPTWNPVEKGVPA